MLALDRESWTITIPASNGRTMKKGIKELRPSITDDSFASIVRSVNDELDAEMSSALSGSTDNHIAEAGEIYPQAVNFPPPFYSEYGVLN